MAEKVKTSFFPHYCTMSHDQAIRIIDRRFRRSLELPESVRLGYQIYNLILEYAAEQNAPGINVRTEEHFEEVADAIRVDPEVFRDFVRYAVELDLFEGGSYEGGILTSNAMRKVRAQIEAKRKAGSMGGKARASNAKAESVE